MNVNEYEFGKNCVNGTLESKCKKCGSVITYEFTDNGNKVYCDCRTYNLDALFIIITGASAP